MLGHIIDGYLGGNTYPEANRGLFCIYNVIYAFHMPLFMMISGYVYTVAYFGDEDRPDQRRIYRQVGNTIAVYVLFCVLLELAKVVFSRYTNTPGEWRKILLIWAVPINPYWYLYDLALFYLLFSVPAIRGIGRGWMLCILVVAAVLRHCISFQWFEVVNVLYYALFFYIGISGRRYPGWMIGNRWIIIGTFALSVILGSVFWDRRPYTTQEEAVTLNSIPVANTLITLGISLMLWSLFQNVKLLSESRFLRMVGRHSLEIYVTHCFFTAGLRTVLSRIGVSNAYVSMAVNLALSTSIPLIGAYICKRVGIYKLIFRPVSFFEEQRRRA